MDKDKSLHSGHDNQTSDDFEQLVGAYRASQHKFTQSLVRGRIVKLLTKLKSEYLVSGSRWATPKNPNWILTVREVYPGRVIGDNPNGQQFRCSTGVFLREQYPVEPKVLDQITSRLKSLVEEEGLPDSLLGTSDTLWPGFSWLNNQDSPRL